MSLKPMAVHYSMLCNPRNSLASYMTIRTNWT